MKTKMMLVTLLITMAGSIGTAQEKNFKDFVWKYDGKKKEHTIGLYAGISGSYTEVMNKPAGWLGAKIGVVFDKRFTLGLAGNALWYDYALDDVVSDGTYHLESGYSGLYFEYLQPLGNRFKLGFSLLTGMGIAKYTYDKDYRYDKPWYQQTIDEQTYSVIEPGIEAMVRIAPKWWIGINGSYRTTSPVRLTGTASSLFNNFNGGIGIRFGAF